MNTDEIRGYEKALDQIAALIRDTGPAPAVEGFIERYREDQRNKRYDALLGPRHDAD